MSNFVRGILATLVVLALASWLYLKLGYADLRAKVEPSWLESDLAVTAIDASAARHAPRQRNPMPSTEGNLLDGARLYRDKCADCHGRPDNPVSDYGASFYPRAPQFMKARPRLPENQNFYIIKYGARWTAMPAWGNIMADSEVWQVVTLLSHLENLPPSVEQELHRPPAALRELRTEKPDHNGLFGNKDSQNPRLTSRDIPPLTLENCDVGHAGPGTRTPPASTRRPSRVKHLSYLASRKLCGKLLVATGRSSPSALALLILFHPSRPSTNPKRTQKVKDV